MKTKKFALLLSFLLVTVMTVNAQSAFDWGDVPYEIVGADTISTAVDTTLVISHSPVTDTIPVIGMTSRTWTRLEKQLKAEFTKNSGKTSQKSVKRQDITWIYEVDDVPVKVGYRKLYLSLLKSGQYLISCENPNLSRDVVSQCYFELSSAGVHQTDDEFFEKHTTTGENKIIKDFWN